MTYVIHFCNASWCYTCWCSMCHKLLCPRPSISNSVVFAGLWLPLVVVLQWCCNNMIFLLNFVFSLTLFKSQLASLCKLKVESATYTICNWWPLLQIIYLAIPLSTSCLTFEVWPLHLLRPWWPFVMELPHLISQT